MSRRPTPAVPWSLLAVFGLCLVVRGVRRRLRWSTTAAPSNPGGRDRLEAVTTDRILGAEPAPPYTMPDVTLTATNGADRST